MLTPSPRVYQPDEAGVNDITLRGLFESEESPLLRYAFSLTGRRAVAEEIVQEAFLQLHKRWGQVDSPRAWLFRSVRNKAFNHLRDNRREELSGDSMDDPNESSEELAPEDLLLRMEMVGVLRSTLDDLSETDRRIIELKYYQGLKYSQISEQTGLTVSNVGYRLHHILKFLAVKLRPLNID